MAAVEFALLVLPFLLLVFGILDLGLGIWTYDNLSEAATQGTRAAIVRGAQSGLGLPNGAGNYGSWACSSPLPSGSIAAEVCTAAVPLDATKLQLLIDWACFDETIVPDDAPVNTACGVGTEVSVRTQYEFQPVVSNFIPMTINLAARSTMPVACCGK